MGLVRIVTDSTADVPAALASALNITIVPLQVHFGREVYQDGVDVQPETFYEQLKQSTDLPRTSQPPVGRFVETYQKLLGEESCEAVVSIHIAGSLSGTINAAWSASQMLPDPSKVEVMDSGQLSMGIGWIAVHAARLAQSGATLAEVASGAKAFLPRVRAAAMIDNLENLYRGGRITLLSAALGSMLQIKPLVSIQGGELLVWGKVRTRSKAMKQLEDHVREWGPLEQMAVLHTGAADRAQNLASALGDLVPEDQTLVLPAGPALTSHLALGAVGVAAVKVDSDAAVPVAGHQSNTRDGMPG